MDWEVHFARVMKFTVISQLENGVLFYFVYDLEENVVLS